MPEQCKITVVGSLNIDYFVRVQSFPKPGETVLSGGDLEIRFGGKGANQAVAAARLGAKVEMIGCVGADEMGAKYLQRLQGFGIGIDGIESLDGIPTGSAFITLDSGSENTIIVAPGANARASTGLLGANRQAIESADCLLLQNEVPHDLNLAAIALARESNTRVLYNPAPWRDGLRPDEIAADILIANELEAASLLGCEIVSAGQLREGLVVTRGANPTLARIGGEDFVLAPDPVDPVDTVGAGDTFCGALATCLGEGRPVAAAIRFANRAAGLATLRTGAQEAMPDRDQMRT